MLDFAKLLADMYENATPEERARMDAARAEREAEEARTRPIAALFVRRAYDGHWKRGKVVEIARETREIGLRIDEPPSAHASDPRVLQFVGGPTGYEAYRLERDFVAALTRGDRGEDFCICAGRAGSYAECSVKTADVVAFLREMAPDLLAQKES